ncbi:MAG: hypothetical protein HZC41_02090 [Chloroflexi bacterium]|nr:hypothetical protein [Chloroflexota bacterium]
MAQERHPQTLLGFPKRFVLYQIIIFGVVTAVWWFGGWRTANDYANALFIAGALIIVFGGQRVFATQSLDRSFKVRYAETVGSDRIGGSSRRLLLESESNFARAARLFLIGLVPILASITIYAVAPR